MAVNHPKLVKLLRSGLYSAEKAAAFAGYIGHHAGSVRDSESEGGDQAD